MMVDEEIQDKTRGSGEKRTYEELERRNAHLEQLSAELHEERAILQNVIAGLLQDLQAAAPQGARP